MEPEIQAFLIKLVGYFLLAHFGAVVSVIVWAFRHIIKYNILLKDFEKIQETVEKLEKDLNGIGNKIRSKTQI